MMSSRKIAAVMALAAQGTQALKLRSDLADVEFNAWKIEQERQQAAKDAAAMKNWKQWLLNLEEKVRAVFDIEWEQLDDGEWEHFKCDGKKVEHNRDEEYKKAADTFANENKEEYKKEYVKYNAVDDNDEHLEDAHVKAVLKKFFGGVVAAAARGLNTEYLPGGKARWLSRQEKLEEAYGRFHDDNKFNAAFQKLGVFKLEWKNTQAYAYEIWRAATTTR